jgi:hypothetical protein
MMLCVNFDTMGNCGKCKYSILSSKLAKYLNILDVSKIGSKLLHKQEFNHSPKVSSTIKSATIDCNKNISLSGINKSRTLDYTVAKTMYCHLIENWYLINNVTSTNITQIEVNKNLSIIRDASNINIIRIYSIKIVKYLEQMTVCNKKCTTIVPHKEVSNCNFCLGDINTIVNFDAIGIVDVFNSILRKMKEVTSIDLYVDVNNSYVKCNGNVSFTLKSKKLCNKSGLDSIKDIYTYYLRAWCSKNISKSTDIENIRSYIDRISGCKSIPDIYTANHKLLTILR